MAQPSSNLTIRIPRSGTLSHLATWQGVSTPVSPSKENVPLGGGDVVRPGCPSLVPEKGVSNSLLFISCLIYSSSVLPVVYSAVERENLEDEGFVLGEL